MSYIILKLCSSNTPSIMFFLLIITSWFNLSLWKLLYVKKLLVTNESENCITLYKNPYFIETNNKTYLFWWTAKLSKSSFWIKDQYVTNCYLASFFVISPKNMQFFEISSSLLLPKMLLQKLFWRNHQYFKLY